MKKRNLAIALSALVLSLASCSGAIGPVGPAGPQGPQGDQGIQGQPGVDGEDGKDGVDGEDGKDGQDGLNGSDGKTAYANTILPALNGYVLPSIGSGIIGEEVTFKVIANEGYKLDTVEVRNGATIYDKTDFNLATGFYTFTTPMVKNGFVVRATFAEVTNTDSGLTDIGSGTAEDPLIVDPAIINEKTIEDIFTKTNASTDAPAVVKVGDAVFVAPEKVVDSSGTDPVTSFKVASVDVLDTLNVCAEILEKGLAVEPTFKLADKIIVPFDGIEYITETTKTRSTTLGKKAYLVSTEAQFAQLAVIKANLFADKEADLNIKLVDDIVLSEDYVRINTFEGTIFGNNHSLTTRSVGANWAGHAFKYFYGTVKDLTIIPGTHITTKTDYDKGLLAASFTERLIGSAVVENVNVGTEADLTKDPHYVEQNDSFLATYIQGSSIRNGNTTNVTLKNVKSYINYDVHGSGYASPIIGGYVMYHSGDLSSNDRPTTANFINVTNYGRMDGKGVGLLIGNSTNLFNSKGVGKGGLTTLNIENCVNEGILNGSTYSSLYFGGPETTQVDVDAKIALYPNTFKGASNVNGGLTSHGITLKAADFSKNIISDDSLILKYLGNNTDVAKLSAEIKFSISRPGHGWQIHTPASQITALGDDKSVNLNDLKVGNLTNIVYSDEEGGKPGISFELSFNTGTNEYTLYLGTPKAESEYVIPEGGYAPYILIKTHKADDSVNGSIIIK
ncbi:MAG TPA: hypothetical protein VJY64_00315 [Candidatus Onthovivens sp.]|nr:hypothetical protein [Candidatus Onthovivens sp.]